jgi:hypothetical protein
MILTIKIEEKDGHIFREETIKKMLEKNEHLIFISSERKEK